MFLLFVAMASANFFSDAAPAVASTPLSAASTAMISKSFSAFELDNIFLFGRQEHLGDAQVGAEQCATVATSAISRHSLGRRRSTCLALPCRCALESHGLVGGDARLLLLGQH